MPPWITPGWLADLEGRLAADQLALQLHQGHVFQLPEQGLGVPDDIHLAQGMAGAVPGDRHRIPPVFQFDRQADQIGVIVLILVRCGRRQCVTPYIELSAPQGLRLGAIVNAGDGGRNVGCAVAEGQQRHPRHVVGEV